MVGLIWKQRSGHSVRLQDYIYQIHIYGCKVSYTWKIPKTKGKIKTKRYCQAARQTDRKTNKQQANKRTNRQANRHTNRQAQAHTLRIKVSTNTYCQRRSTKEQMKDHLGPQAPKCLFLQGSVLEPHHYGRDRFKPKEKVNMS